MIRADDYFEDLLMRVVEGMASEEEFATFQEIIRQNPEDRRRYAREMRLHALLCCRGTGKLEAGGWEQATTECTEAQREDGGRRVGGRGKATTECTEVKRDAGGWRVGRRQSAVGCGGTWRKTWWKAAVAAAALAVVAVTVWQATKAGSREELGGRSGSRLASGPVALVREAGAAGLELPGALPGTVRLEKGRATVRLASGVALTLLGPLELEVRDAMLVRLQAGRLLAEVPPAAGGFTVRTDELELWDIGTVFGVSAGEGRSEVFVFKGEVQVNEASGEPVDLCVAGEGVYAQPGARPVKVAADWPEARRVFAAVRGGGAVGSPDAALKVAVLIADMWTERYAPEEAWRIRDRKTEEAARRAAAERVPFSKKAWVRASVPMVQEEENMTTAQVVAALAASVTMMGAMPSGGTSAPIRVDTSPHHNRHWMTVFTNDVPLRWEWPAAAVSAELSIVGMGSTFATNFTEVTTAYSWRAFATPTPVTENVYTLALTFRDGGGGVVGTQSARLAVLAGAFGRITVDPGPSDRRWEKVKDDVVIPYDAGWAEATADAETSRLVIAKGGGATQDNLLPDASGYFGWKLKNSGWGYGAFTLALTFPGTQGEWAAALTYVPGGTILSVR